MGKEIDDEKEVKSHVTITIQGEGQSDVSMRIRRNVHLKKAAHAYCDKLGLNYESLRFTFDGTKINDLQTAEDLGLEDGAVIDAWSDQSGGGGSVLLLSQPSLEV